MGSSRRWWAAVLVSGLVVTGLAACSGSATTGATSSPVGANSGVAAAGDAVASGQASANSPSQLGAVQQPAERKQIRNGNMTLAVASGGDIERVADDAVTAANDAGGRVDADRRVGGDSPTVDLVLRVPPDRLDETVDRIGALATVTDSSIQTDDVTNQYTDLEGRIDALQTSTARLRGFLADARDANQIASLENELTRREADLESLQGQLRVLSAKTDLATLKVAVRTQQAVAAASAPAPAQALGKGWDTFSLTVAWVVAVVLATLPFLVLAAMAAIGVRWWRRHRKTPQPADVAT